MRHADKLDNGAVVYLSIYIGVDEGYTSYIISYSAFTTYMSKKLQGIGTCYYQGRKW
jgi:hypothetical protein